MRINLAYFFLFGFVLCSSTHAFDKSMCPSQPIRFGHYEMGALYGKGRGGIDEDFLQVLIRQSGCEFAVSLRPRARGWFELEAGNLDMMASGIQTAERDKFAWFAPYLMDKKFVLLGPTVPENIKSIDQFLAEPKLTVGGVRSFKYSPFYDVFIEKLEAMKRLQQVDDLETVYRMFARGRFDATIASPLAYQYYLKVHRPQGEIRYMNWDIGARGASALVLSKKHFTEKQATQWQLLVQSLIADGTVLKILTKHLGEVEAKASVYRH